MQEYCIECTSKTYIQEHTDVMSFQHNKPIALLYLCTPYELPGA